MEWIKKNLKVIGIIALVLALAAPWVMYRIESRKNDKLREELGDLSTQILNHQIEATVHGSVETGTADIKTSSDASDRLNNIVNRKIEGR